MVSPWGLRAGLHVISSLAVVFRLAEQTLILPQGGHMRLEGGAASIYGALDYQEAGRLSLTLSRGGYDITGIERETGVSLLTAQGETQSDFWDAEIAARSTTNFGRFALDHGLAVSAGRIKVNGYSETGATGLALQFDDQAFNYKRLMLDANLQGPDFMVFSALTFTPLADIAYIHQFGDDDYGLRSQLIGNTAQSVTRRSQAPAEDRIDAGIGARIALGERWAISTRYAHQWASDIESADEVSLSLAVSF